ncbi:hypothetical protein L1987_51362 [Smallanthus sonchifolius]|uniref:Uncharacterized protein n=1 Tax=Smallanthus sonchifolius TaxID=185202 RepID=A0ACB9EPG7_9ASTR|nr:hypothetical protein L1987_51362 [Smallanthus sonchifolius]
MTTISGIDNWVQFNSHENQCFDLDDEEDSLSLCNLPTNDQEIDKSSNTEANDQEDFEFGSGHAAASSPENMCNAEDVFFQGQILPLRSASMSVENGYGYKPKIRNKFHSHPSPSPQIRTQSFRTFSHSKPKTTSLWSFLQVGLVKPQEIGLSDLKNRSKRSGSHNSSTSGSMNSTKDQKQNNVYNNNNNHRKKTKKKPRLFISGCNCSPDSIERTITETVPKRMTRHRTFEWLKQLSIAAPTEA